ncbi:hypothetical protein FOS14_14835 [Skermania sp. ID1734]|uniref:hypothetical protein n=1 Tax=Skermania sp. ID1734 TaxID=2597516 RepID=UPI00117DEC83|nr:hypothetical protein [Skermania sp. ID1734]TSD97261.1 hypothetical protein FOS14_14835 [Skermania sp. ID1734]
MDTRAGAVAVAAAAIVGFAGATASAEPLPPPAAPILLPPPAAPISVPTKISVDVLPGVHYTSDTADGSTMITTGMGSLTTRGGQFQVLDNQAHLLAGTPLTLQPDTRTWPQAAQPSAASVPPAAPVSLAAPVAAVVPAPVHPADAQSDFNSALSVAATQFGLAVTIGTLAGGTIGILLGCPLGAVTFGLTGIVTGPVDPLVAGLGCLVGAGTGAGIGGILGGLILGVPVGIASAVQMYNTLHAQGDI